MELIKEINKYPSRERCGEYCHTIKYRIKGNEVFIDHNGLTTEGLAFINILNLNNEEFLKCNNIDYIIKDKRLLPIGVVDFSGVQGEKYNSCELKMCCFDERELYKCMDILKNIEDAIKTKYQCVKFRELVNKTETIELD